MCSQLPPRPKLALPLLLTFIITACGGTLDAEEGFRAATQSLQQGQTAQATIQLKNVLTQQPDHSPARQALGGIYFDRGLFIPAEKEFQRSLKTALNPGPIKLKLAEIALLRGQPEDVAALVSETDPLPTREDANLLALNAIAHMVQNRSEAANKALVQAAEEDATAPFVLVAQAYRALQEGESEQAVALLENLEAEFTSPLASSLAGQLKTLTGDMEASISQFEALVKNYPEHPQFRLQLAQSYMTAKQREKAAPLIDQLLQTFPNHPVANYLKADLEALAGNLNAAQKHAEKTLNANPGNPQARLLAGLAAYKLERYEQAYDHLLPLRDSLPPQSSATRALIALQLRLGHADQYSLGAESLNPDNPQDLALLQQTSAQLLGAGKLASALSLTEKVSSQHGENLALATLQGQLQLLADPVKGRAQLEETLTRDPDMDAARLSLARRYLQDGDFDAAMTLARDWIILAPKNPRGYLLAALVENATGQLEQAEARFREVLEFTPDSLSGRLGLGEVLMRQGKLEAAADELLAALELAPGYSGTLNRLLQLGVQNESTDGLLQEKIITSLRTTREEASAEEQGRSIAAEASLLAINGNIEKAINLLRDTPQDQRSEGQAALLGDLYAAQDNLKGAARVYAQGLKTYPDSLVLLIRHVGLLELQGATEQALKSATEALTRQPGQPQLTLAAANLHWRQRQFSEARELLATVPREALERMPQYWRLKGTLDMAEGDTAAGVVALENFHQRLKTPGTAVYLASALATAGQLKRAEDLLRQWPEDSRARLQLASLLLDQDRQEDAADAYRQLLIQDPDNLIALNNLAGIEITEQRLEAAAPLVQRALALAPQHPAVLDTQGRLELARNNPDKALVPLARAHEQVPGNEEIRLHYAQALHLSGETERAQALVASLEAKSLSPRLQAVLKELGF